MTISEYGPVIILGNSGENRTSHTASQLNPVERLWLYLRERFLSLRMFEDQDTIIDACCHAWNAVADDAERIKSLCLQPWIREVISK